MLRRVLPLLVVATVLLGLVASRGLPPVLAQEGTPAAGPPELPPGITAEFIGGTRLGELPADPGLIVLVRLTLAPGAAFPPDPNDPTGAFVVVESGALTVRSAAPLTVSRASEADFVWDELAADTAATLDPGDAVYVGPFQATEARNDGDQPAVILLVNILPAEGNSGEATPAA